MRENKRRLILYLWVSLASGAAVLGLEVLAARTLAPSLGSGSVTWSALLAVALGCLALGNLAGGVLCGRARPDRPVFYLLAIASAALLVFSQVYGAAMHWAAGHTILWGSIMASLLTQGIPMALLGSLTPLLIRQGEAEAQGRWAGAVLACGSAGGIAGALAIGLWLLPEAGLARSFLALSMLLLFAAVMVAVTGRYGYELAVAGVMLIAAILLFLRPHDRHIVHSRYGQIETRILGGQRVLLFDGLPQGNLPHSFEPWSGLSHGCLLEAALLLNPGIREALVIGLGTGLAPRLLGAHGISCECVEIDPKVKEISRKEFGFDGKVTLADGRVFLEKTNRQWDLIVLDVCTSDHLAFHLFTRESFDLIRGRLAPEGLLAVQFIGGEGQWCASVARTVETVFGESILLAPAAAFPVGIGPCWIFAGRDSLPYSAREINNPDLSRFWRIIRPQEEGYLLTDDRFAAERAWFETALRWRRIYAVSDDLK